MQTYMQKMPPASLFSTKQSKFLVTQQYINFKDEGDLKVGNERPLTSRVDKVPISESVRKSLKSFASTNALASRCSANEQKC